MEVNFENLSRLPLPLAHFFSVDQNCRDKNVGFQLLHSVDGKISCYMVCQHCNSPVSHWTPFPQCLLLVLEVLECPMMQTEEEINK